MNCLDIASDAGLAFSRVQGGWRIYRCPDPKRLHNNGDSKPSLNVKNDGKCFKCYGCGAKGGPRELRELVNGHNLGKGLHVENSNGNSKPRGKIVATYPYYKDGKLHYQKVRYDGKHFRGRRPDGKGGWIHSLDGQPHELTVTAIPLQGQWGEHLGAAAIFWEAE